MAAEEDADAEVFINVGVTGAGKGAAKLVGFAKERKTALAFCLPAEDTAAASAASFSLAALASASSSDFLLFGGLGLADSSASSSDLRGAALLPFLEAIVLALALGGPQ